MSAKIKIKLTKARLAFPHLFVPSAMQREDGSSGKPTFQATLLFKPTDPQLELIRKTMKEVSVQQWAKDADKQFKALTMGLRVCLIDGDTKPDTGGYAGHWVLKANSKTRPMVVDSDQRTPLMPADGRPYGGCYVNASVDIWAQDNQFGKRINAGLVAVMFHSHGEPFGGGSIPQDNEFEGMGAGEEESEFA